MRRVGSQGGCAGTPGCGLDQRTHLPTASLLAADLFDILLPMLNIYQEFVRNHQYSLQILAHCKQNRDFDKLLKHYEAKPDCEERTLETFLTYPMFQVTAGTGIGPGDATAALAARDGMGGANPSPTAGIRWWGGKARTKMAWGWTPRGPTLLTGPAQAIAGLVSAAGGLSG